MTEYVYTVRFTASRLNESDLRDYLETTASHIAIERVAAGGARMALDMSGVLPETAPAAKSVGEAIQPAPTLKGTIMDRVLLFLNTNPRVFKVKEIEKAIGAGGFGMQMTLLVRQGLIQHVRHGYYAARGVQVSSIVHVSGVKSGSAEERLLALVTERPQTRAALGATLGVTRQRVEQLISKLIARRLVKAIAIEGRMVGYLYVSADYDTSKITPYLPTATARTLSALPLAGAVTIFAINTHLKVSLQQVQSHLVTLKRLHLVSTFGRGRTRGARLTEAGAKHWQYDKGAPKVAGLDGAKLMKPEHLAVMQTVYGLGDATTRAIRLVTGIVTDHTGVGVSQHIQRLQNFGYIEPSSKVSRGWKLTEIGRGVVENASNPMPDPTLMRQLLQSRLSDYMERQRTRAAAARAAWTRMRGSELQAAE